MKKIFFLFAFSLLLTSQLKADDWGCIGDVCVGDEVTKGADGGMVVEIDPKTKTVIMANTSGVHKVPVTQLNSGKGCLDNVCVGDAVFNGKTYTGVMAVDKKNKTVTVMKDPYKNQDNSVGDNVVVKPNQLVMGFGCIKDLCVGAKTPSGDEQIVGVNPLTNEIIVSRGGPNLYFEKFLSKGRITPQTEGYFQAVKGENQILIKQRLMASFPRQFQGSFPSRQWRTYPESVYKQYPMIGSMPIGMRGNYPRFFNGSYPNMYAPINSANGGIFSGARNAKDKENTEKTKDNNSNKVLGK